MKVTELKNEGLNRKYSIEIPAEEILKKVEEELKDQQKSFKMSGFRDGNVPLDMIRKKEGPALLTAAIEKEVDAKLKELFEEKNIRPAMQPVVEVESFDDKKSLKFSVKMEILPEVPQVDWSKISIETFNVKVGQEDLEKAHNDILANFNNFEDAPDSHKAKKGDAVVIDFVGTMDGKEFDGGKGEGVRLEIGGNQFIPGFEEQLIGAKKGDSVKVRVVFPKDYNAKDLAGKPAVFDVKVAQVLKPESVEALDDEFAKKLGVSSMDKLNEMISEKIESDFNGIARLRMKKQLFDVIDSEHKFDIPEGMYKVDFDTMWSEVQAQRKANPAAFKGQKLEDTKKEYEEIARRRVRLGIILAEVARENNIEIDDSDIQKAIYSEAMMRPGQEKMIIDFYQKPENSERLKGPILEEKAVDFILTKVKKEEIEISSKDFFEKYGKEFNVDSEAV